MPLSIVDDGISKWRSGAFRLICHRMTILLPIFILKIALIIILAIVCAVFLAKNVALNRKLEWQPHPLVIVPGMFGSKLYMEGFGIEYPAELEGCQTNIPLRKAWVSDQLVNNTECELYRLSLVYNSTSGKFHNQPNVEVTANLRGIPFGSSLWPIQCTYSDEHPLYCDYSTLKGLNESYMRRFSEFLMSKLKYQAGKTLFAAQYDWRHHLNSDVLSSYYADLAFLVEHAVNMTRKKAILFGHSMGNIVINQFLKDKVSKEWQQRHLRATINVAPPFGGDADSLRVFLSTRAFVLPNGSISQQSIVKFYRSLSSPANFLPRKSAFGAYEWLIKIGQNRQFSASQMEQFLEFVNSSHLWPIHRQYEPVPQKTVPMYCIYSMGQNNTERQFVFKSVDDQKPEVIMGDGDGTVGVESLRICEKWKAEGHTVSIMEFPVPGPSHTELLMKTEFFQYVAKLLISF